MSEISSPGRTHRARRRENWVGHAESLGIAIGAPLLTFAMKLPDPFFVAGSFPWLVLVPLAIGAQHGLLPAVLGTSVLGLGAWAHAAFLGGAEQGLGPWMTGCFLVAIVAGGLKDHALRRGREIEARAEDLAGRLLQLTRAHRVLGLSHARLEERLFADAWSLEGVVQQASKDLARAATPARVYGVVLDVLASQAQIQAASFLRCAAGRLGAAPGWRCLEATPAASLGSVTNPGAPHPIVERALLTRQVALLAPESMSDASSGAVLAAVPLVTSRSRLLGVIVVHEMSFIAFTRETFVDIDSIAQALADQVAARLAELDAASEPRAAVPCRELEVARVSEREAPRRERSKKQISGIRLRLEEPPASAAAPASAPARAGQQRS